MSWTCLPHRVSQGLRVLRPWFRHRHQLGFSWLLVLPLVYSERANLKVLAQYGPAHLAYQPSRRLWCASSWCTKTLRWWFADQALQAFAPPADGLRSLVGDRTLKGTRGSKPPVAHNTRLNRYHPSVVGFRIVLLMAKWDVSRSPVAFALVRRQGTSGSHTENALLRQLLQHFRPPAWCQEVIGVAEAAYASRANRELIHTRGYGYVMALPRTWKWANGKALQALVSHRPRWQ